MWWAWVRGNLWRRPGLMTLFVLELALAALVICTSFTFAQSMTGWGEQFEQTGLAELQVIEIWWHRGGTDRATAARREAADLAVLRAQPGVIAVDRIDSMPQERVRQPRRAFAATGGTGIMVFPLVGGLELPAVAGVRLTGGRVFTPADLTATGPVPVILAGPVADALFPAGAVGQQLVLEPGAERCQVVGVAERIASGPPSYVAAEHGMVILDRHVDADGRVKYAVRGEPAAVRRGAAALAALDRDRLIYAIPARAINIEALQTNQRASWWSLGAALAITLIALFSAIAMGALLSAERRRDIGILRALGATRRDVIRLFVIDHLAMATVGLVLGSVAAVLLHRAMSSKGMMPLAAGNLALTWLMLLGTSALAALLSCRRAADTPPHTATRMV